MAIETIARRLLMSGFVLITICCPLTGWGQQTISDSLSNEDRVEIVIIATYRPAKPSASATPT